MKTQVFESATYGHLKTLRRPRDLCSRGINVTINCPLQDLGLPKLGNSVTETLLRAQMFPRFATQETLLRMQMLRL